MIAQLVQEALPPEFAMPERLSAEGQRAWKVITDFLQRRKLTHSGGHDKVFYSPEEWKRRGEEEVGGELYIIHDGGEHARAISWEAEDEKSREALQTQLRSAGMFMEQITYVTSGVYKITPVTDPKPHAAEPAAAPAGPAGLESAVSAARAFLSEDDFPPVGVNQRRSRRDRLARLRRRRGEDSEGRPLKEGDAQPGYDIPHDEHPEDFPHGHQAPPEEEEQDEITLGKSILKHIELLRAAIPDDLFLPPGVIKNLDIIKQQAEQLLTMHGADTDIALESQPVTATISAARELLAEEEQEKEGDPVEAYGVMGVKSKPWRRRFKNRKAFQAWLDKHEGDVEVHASRKAD